MTEELEPQFRACRQRTEDEIRALQMVELRRRWAAEREQRERERSILGDSGRYVFEAMVTRAPY